MNKRKPQQASRKARGKSNDSGKKQSSQAVSIGLRELEIRPVAAGTGASEAPGTPPVVSPLAAFATSKQACEQFADSARGLLLYAVQASQMADRAEVANFAKLMSLLRKLCSSPAGARAEQVYEVRAEIGLVSATNGATVSKTVRTRVSDAGQLRKLNELLERKDAAYRIIHDTTIQQMVNGFEQLMADLLAARYVAHPEHVPASHQLVYGDVKGLLSTDELLAFVISKEVERFLAETSESQVELVCQHIHKALAEKLCWKDDAVEVLLRRHTLVHSGGIASRDYVRRLGKLTGFSGKPAPVGARLSPGGRYVRDAWDLLYALGVILGEGCWRKWARAEAEKEQAESFLNAAGFEAMKLGRFAAGERIFAHATETREFSGHAEMAKINHAICLKALQKEGWEKLVDKKSWSSSAPQYEMGAAAVRGDFEEFRRQLSRVKSADADFDPAFFYEWPVFRWLRDHPQFESSIQAVWKGPKARPRVHHPVEILSAEVLRKLDLPFRLTQEELTSLFPSSVTKPGNAEVPS